MNLNFPVSAGDNIRKFREFTKKISDLSKSSTSRRGTIVDAHGGMPCLTDREQCAVRKLDVIFLTNEVYSNMHCFNFLFEIDTDFTPHNERRFPDAADWIRRSAELVLHRVAKELVAQAGIPANALISTSGAHVNMDTSEYTIKFNAEFAINDPCRIRVSISVCEQPDFWVDEIAAAISMPTSAVQDEQHLQLFGLPVSFVRNHDEHQSDTFTLQKSRSKGFVELVQQQLADKASEGIDRLHDCINSIVCQTAEQLKQCISEQF